MAEVKPLYSTCVAVLGFICFVVGATAVGIPMWGYFDNLSGRGNEERGYFGPWKTCKLLLYNRERCGNDSSNFKATRIHWKILLLFLGILGRSVSVTDASGKPYMPTASNGSMASMNTTSTTIGSTNGSTVGSSVTRSPLRSSLKKPKPKDGLGIQNPGFSGTSPTLSRNGSTKKVRIQTHSTEV
ncbi:uncharacterized protein LOC123005119 [Tribolium madens]|uniref:uncharacterized protein LOC123005119 n=1 Tax=Tribolium madens TaxID=41895 RepID=UPI001CF726A3|nr:uncharacterized protein LOC123005119 [Tribolium madens]